MLKTFVCAGFAATISLALLSSAGAVSVQGNVRDVPYVIGFHPLHSTAHPYLGQMHLNFNNGIISGTYTDISVKPGSPLANVHNAAVSGGVSSSHVTLVIRQVTFRGSMHGEKMSGSATIHGTIYEWAAQQGSPGSGK